MADTDRWTILLVVVVTGTVLFFTLFADQTQTRPKEVRVLWRRSMPSWSLEEGQNRLDRIEDALEALQGKIEGMPMKIEAIQTWTRRMRSGV